MTSSLALLKDPNYDYLVKVVCIGDSGVGKSCLVKQLCERTFEDSHVSTIGVDFAVTTKKVEDRTVKLQIWDTAGQERFRTVTLAYYRGAQAAVIVFDVTCRESFESVPNWFNEVRKYTEEGTPIIIIANKVDQETKRVVSIRETEELVKNLDANVHVIETSAKTSRNVDAAFADVATQFAKKVRVLGAEKGKIKETGVPISGETTTCPSCLIL